VWLFSGKTAAPLQMIRTKMRGTANNRSAEFSITVFMEFVIIYPLLNSILK
jgi:hypothetical protein